MRKLLLKAGALGAALLCLAWASAVVTTTRAAATFTVTSASDTDDGVCDADCTLREAISAANALPGADEIHFNIPPGGRQTIAVNSTSLGDLPAITDGVTIDGRTQPGYDGAPVIELDGALGTIGLQIESWETQSAVHGLAVNGFSLIGIYLFEANATLTHNYIGTDVTGAIADGSSHGVFVYSASAQIADNVISGNDIGINLELSIGTEVSIGTVVVRNKIGTDASGSVALGNRIGVEVHRSPSNTIGQPGAGNVISGNDIGIEFAAGTGPSSTTNVVDANLIGTNPTGTSAVGGGIGIVAAVGSNTIKDNVISGLTDSGIVTAFSGSIVATGNKIGTDITGTQPLGNGTGIRILQMAPGSQIESNVISANAQDGIRILSGSGHIVRGNIIGGALDFIGGVGPPQLEWGVPLPLSNGGHGVLINSGFVPSAMLEENVIVHNGGDGVRMLDASRVTISRNAFFRNGGMPIAGIATTTKIAQPFLTSATPNVAGMTPACPFCTIEIFDAEDDEGLDIYAEATTDINGAFSVALGGFLGSCVAVTVTDGNGNTSEFASIALAPGGANNDGNLIDMAPLVYDDITRPQSDEASDDCDGDDDNDGLSDLHEASLPGIACPPATAATDAAKVDTDGDLILDGIECLLGSDPADISSIPAQPTPANDVDGDAIPTGLDPNDAAMDADGDGISDSREFFVLGTNLFQADGDSDGCSDAREVASINGDRAVSSIDLSQVAQHFALGEYAKPAPAYVVNFDVNRDGKISSIDLGQVAQRFGPC